MEPLIELFGVENSTAPPVVSKINETLKNRGEPPSVHYDRGPGITNNKPKP